MRTTEFNCHGEIIETATQAVNIFLEAVKKAGALEGFFVLPLDANGRVLDKPTMVAIGHKGGSVDVDLGEVFRVALRAGAEEIYVAHNHPSNNLTPTNADLVLTKELKDLCARLNVKLLDHFIIATTTSKTFKFLSLAESIENW